MFRYPNAQTPLLTYSWDSSVGIVTRLQAGQAGFDSWQGQETFLFSKMSRLALEPTQPPIQWVPGTLFLKVKQQSCETDHLLPSSAKVNNGGAKPTFPPCLYDILLNYIIKYKE
jgi:hypothetical protein